MKWEMEMEEIEAILEKIWDLHDKLSDAIHSISRSHFLNSINNLKKSEEVFFSRSEKKKPRGIEGEENRSGFVFVKDFRGVVVDDDDRAVAEETKSLNAIRTALENLEDQLEFFHLYLCFVRLCYDFTTMLGIEKNLVSELCKSETVQSQQRAERDAAVARLEQSRIVLAMRLSDHHGKRYKVIEEALAFVGDVQDTGRFVSPENLFESPRSRQSGENHERNPTSNNILIRVLVSTFTFAKKSLRLEQMGGVLGNAALVAVSMVAFLHLHHQATFKSTFATEGLQMQEDSFYGKNKSTNTFEKKGPSSSSNHMRDLDVLAARG
ncbi:hypothetical protein GIB67_034880 [Kingdonia uniflora]|uniref:Plastid division protein PDV1 n=1 Tax=Kingdonia uniflora TaxID=39325 RepID=A0A7J7KVS3_9MAGN|nr:hypothetical protein GIB67_034880 [Kingdonia uniflora]